MRPASHMPLAAMMMWKPVSLAIDLLSSTVSVKRRCGEFEQPVDVDIRIEAFARAAGTPRWRGWPSGELRKIGAVGISPRSIRSTRSTMSSCVRSTAKAGMSRAPSRPAPRALRPRDAARRDSRVIGGRSPSP